MQGTMIHIGEKPQSYGHLRATEGQARADLAHKPPPPGRMRSAAPVGPSGRTGTILALDPANRI
jgi:hypothetical protein